MNNKKVKRICLWSGPRNISTALMYSFAQRKDTKVVDEPLYAHYLSSTNASEYHPGAREVLNHMENDGKKVVEQMYQENEKPVIFFKQMAHHLVNIDLNFLDDVQNIILTRDPEEMLTSYTEHIESPGIDDVGYLKQYELMTHLQKRGQKPIVLLAKEILKNPKQKLSLLCKRLDIPFDPAMLKWKRGPRPEDGIWAKYWYKSVHNSTEFAPYSPKNAKVPDELMPLLEECRPVYNELVKYAL